MSMFWEYPDPLPIHKFQDIAPEVQLRPEQLKSYLAH